LYYLIKKMANREIEVEIKVPVSKKVFEKVRKHLKKNGKFLNSSYEIDKYFNAPHRNFLKKKHPTEYLRIRTKGSNGSFTYKNAYFNESGEKTHSDEFESKVDNPSQIEKILKVLNFDNFLTIDKKRETYTYKDEFEIALDKVKGLGYFVEIEATRNFGSNEQTLKKLFFLAEGMGIDTSRKDKDGYALLLLKKKQLLSKS